MAFQIDPSIPLQAQRTMFDPAAILMQAQQNGAALEKHRFEMQKLREDYDLAKEKRKQQKAMRQGMASELQKMQQGTPAQYRTTFPQTMPTGQMPQGMTGVLASERGQNLPQPALFGENILQGNFDINRELVSPAIAPKKPDIKDILTAQLNAAVANNDVATAFDAKKKLRELEKSPDKYFGGLTEAIDPVTKQPILLAMTEGGAVPSGYAPNPKEKEKKATPVMVNGVPKTVKVPSTNEVKILMSDGTLSAGGSIPAPKSPEEPTPEFTEAAINNAAARYNIDGTLPPMGMGKGGATARSLILNRAAELASGVDGTDQRVAQLTTKASASTLLQLKKTKTMIKAFEEMANKNADIALEMSAKVDRSGTPVVNRWFLAANNKIAGDVDTATFNTAVNVFANEYAKIMSGSMGNTPVSDSARKEAHEILNTAQTPAQLRANIKLLQREMKNRIIGLDESEAELIQQMKGGKKEDAHGGGGKDPYAITKDMNPKYVDYLMAHKELVRMKDFEGANMLTEMYKRGAK